MCALLRRCGAVQVKADHHTARACACATATRSRSSAPRPRHTMTSHTRRQGRQQLPPTPPTGANPRPTARFRWWSSSRARPSGRLTPPRQTRWARDKPHGSKAPGPCRERIANGDPRRSLSEATGRRPGSSGAPTMDDQRKRHFGPRRGTSHRHDIVVCELAVGASSSAVAVATRHMR
jgi:hypothetical protein